MMTQADFGKIFKKTREKRGLGIEEASRQSQIRPTVIKDIEGGVFNRLADVYVKSFMKKYSDFLGLDTADIMNKYGSLRGEVTLEWAKQHTIKDAKPLRKRGMVEGGFLFENVPGEETAPPASGAEKPASSAVQTRMGGVISRIGIKPAHVLSIFLTVSILLLLIVVTSSVRTGKVDGGAKGRMDGHGGRTGIRPDRSQALEASSIVPVIPEGKTGIESGKTPEIKNAAATGPSTAPGSVRKDKNSAAAVLILAARGEVWVKVLDSDKVVYTGILNKGDSKKLETNGILTVWTGKGENLLFTLNGRDLGRIVNGVARDIQVSGQGVKLGDKWITRLE